MDNLKAINIVEGFDDAASHEEYIKAWQYLVDSGLAWKLQGYFSRRVHELIAAGEIEYKPPRKHTPRLDYTEEARW